MIAQIRGEMLKIRSTRTVLGLLLGMIALALLFSLLTGFLAEAPLLTGKENQLNLLGLGSISGTFAALAGIMVVTSEYRFGTIRPTLLFNPNRNRVLGSKMVAGIAVGLVFGVIGEGLAYIVGYLILDDRGIPIALSGGDVLLLIVGAVIGAALWGALGVGLGAAVPNQVGAIIALLAWGFIAENIVFAFLPSVGRYLPVHAENSMIGYGTPHLIGIVPGAAVLVGWTVLLCLVGAVLLNRRDVN